MSLRPRTVAVVGADVRTREGWPNAVWWQSAAHPPLAAAPGAPLADELARRAVAATGLSPSGLRVFPCGAGVDGGAGPLAALADAYNAIRTSSCEIAVVVALDPAESDGVVPSAALVLGTHVDEGEAKGCSPLAILRIVLARPGLAADGDRFPLLLEACARGAVNPHSVTLVDVHGPVADRSATMRESIQMGFSRGAAVPSHCAVAPGVRPRSAAESLALVCAHVLALANHVLPPYAGPADADIAPPWCASGAPRAWIETTPRRSALWLDLPDGEGALVLEESPALDRLDARPTSTRRQDLTLVSGADREALAARLEALAGGGAEPGSPPHGRWRAAIIAPPGDRAAKARRLAAAVRSSGQEVYQTPDGLFFADAAAQRGKTVMLFPGQGAQYVGMFGDLSLDVRGVQRWFDELQDSRLEAEPYPPALLIAPPELGLPPAHAAALGTAMEGLGSGALLTMTASIAMFDVLTRAGVRADAMAGYSNGENTALICAGTIDDRADIFGFMRIIRLHDENDSGHVRGRALAVNRAPRQALDEGIARAGGALFVSLDNCPDQVVLFGDPDAIDEAAASLTASGAMCLRLPFERGHHTPAFAPCARQLRVVYADVDIARARLPIYSCAIAAPYPADRELARDLAASQWARCVRFRDTVERLYADGFRCFVEVGPGSTLTGFVRSTLKGRPHVAVPTNIAGRSGLDQLLSLVARLFVFGHDVRVDAVFGTREPSVAARGSSAGTRAHETGLTTGEFRATSPEPPRATSAEPPPPDPGSPIADPGVAAAMAVEHFRLMQEFLDSQLRAHEQILAAIAPRTPDAAPPAARGSRPFDGDVISRTAERLVSRLTLRTDDDLFLWHHAPGAALDRRGVPGHGLPIVPFSVSLEMAVAAAARLMHWSGPAFTIRQVRASRWLALDEEALELRIEARVRTNDAGSSAVCVSISAADAAHPAFEAIVTDGAAPAHALPIVPRDPPTLDAAAFNRRLFHGPLFRGVTTVIAGDEESIRLEAVVPSEGEWSAGGPEPSHFLPLALLDLVSQTVGVWLAHCGEERFGFFPYALDACEQFGPAPPRGTRTTIAGDVRVSGSTATADLDVCLPDGSLLSRVTGLSGRVLYIPEPLYSYVFQHGDRSRLSESAGAGRRRVIPPSDTVLADGQGIWLRVLGRMVLTAGESRDWDAVEEAARIEWLLDRLVAKEIALDVLAAAGVAVLPKALETVRDGSAFIVTACAAGAPGLEAAWGGGAADFRIVVAVEPTPVGAVAALVPGSAMQAVTLDGSATRGPA